jgi:hypothetical protein
MPYKAKGKCIYQKDTGKKVGCTTGSIKKYMSALHANVTESFDDAVMKYLEEMMDTRNSSNVTGATTTTTASQDGQIQSINHNSTTQRDPNDPAYQKETCVGKDHNNNAHIQEVQQKLKLKTPQEAKALIQQYKQTPPAPNTQPLNKPVYSKPVPAAAAAAAPSTTYSTHPAI